MIAAVILMSVTMVGIVSVVAYSFATYALPLMFGFAAAHVAYLAGSGLIGAGLLGLLAGVAAFGVFSALFSNLGSPTLRLILALIFAAPAALAGYALVHGVTHEAIPSPIWRQIFCIIGGALVGVSALTQLAGSATTAQRR